MKKLPFRLGPHFSRQTPAPAADRVAPGLQLVGGRKKPGGVLGGLVLVVAQADDGGHALLLGRPVKIWNDAMICNRCEKSNWDGIVPRDGFLRRLKDAGVNGPELNDKGFIPIPR